MEQISLQAEKGCHQALRTAFMVAARSVITDTPADVGTAKSNWLPSIDSSVEGTRTAYFPGKDGSTAGENAAAAIEAAELIAESYNGRAHRSLHLTNNTKQIGFLNAGSSKQAPALFVEAAVARGVTAAQGVKVLD